MITETILMGNNASHFLPPPPTQNKNIIAGQRNTHTREEAYLLLLLLLPCVTCHVYSEAANHVNDKSNVSGIKSYYKPFYILHSQTNMLSLNKCLGPNLGKQHI